jgi:hypothetical protein
LPATEEQIDTLYDLLKKCNKRIVDAVNKAVDAVGEISVNVDKKVLCQKYMSELMKNCGQVIGPHMTAESRIITRDIKLV